MACHDDVIKKSLMLQDVLHGKNHNSDALSTNKIKNQPFKIVPWITDMFATLSCKCRYGNGKGFIAMLKDEKQRDEMIHGRACLITSY